MRIVFACACVSLLALGSAPLNRAFADDTPASSSGTGTGFDSIVRDLTNSNVYDSRPATREQDPLDTVRFHLSGGMVTSQISLDLPGGLPQSATLHGYEVGLGIDLFSPNWQAQFDVRTYEPDDFGNNQLTFHEFDLLVLHNSAIASQLSWTIGAGMAARYLDLKFPVTAGGDTGYSTPASVIATGLSFAFTPGFSVDALVSLRSRLVEDTPDAGSIDGAIHLTGHF